MLWTGSGKPSFSFPNPSPGIRSMTLSTMSIAMPRDAALPSETSVGPKRALRNSRISLLGTLKSGKPVLTETFQAPKRASSKSLPCATDVGCWITMPSSSTSGSSSSNMSSTAPKRLVKRHKAL